MFARQTLTGGLDERIVFVHVPKCAGTSVDGAIRRLYRSAWDPVEGGRFQLDPGAANEVGDVFGRTTWEVRRSIVAYHLARPDSRYVTGHFQVDRALLDEFGDEYAFVTMLRHPVDRWLSHYFHNVYSPSDNRFHIESDIESFAETERARGIGQIYLSFFSGTGDMSPEERLDSEEVRRTAIENLERFDVVGILEEKNAFLDDFRRRFGVPLRMLRENTSSATRDEKDVSTEIRGRIREICAADIELYEEARRWSGR